MLLSYLVRINSKMGTRKNTIGLALCLALFPTGAMGEPKSDTERDYRMMREAMVENQMVKRDIRSPLLLHAMRNVPRHFFIPEKYRRQAYEDYPIPIGGGQTISQPYIVAKMTELVDVKKGSKVLEIGTGSGYQAGVLATMGAEVFSIEIIQILSDQAKDNLQKTGLLDHVHLKVGDGYQGWPDEAPFDAIIVTAAPEKVPEPLKEQLKPGGKLVIPLGSTEGVYARQELRLLEKKEDGSFKDMTVFPVSFVPMTGEAQKN